MALVALHDGVHLPAGMTETRSSAQYWKQKEPAPTGLGELCLSSILLAVTDMIFSAMDRWPRSRHLQKNRFGGA